MTRKPVLHNPNKELREKSREVEVEEILHSDFQLLIDDMMETMKAENGIGLAAPQIGIHKRLIIVEMPTGPKAYINPRIVKTSARLVESEEGCLSVPNVWGLVKRHKRVTVIANTRDGAEVKITASGLISVIFQHEIDHLDGILFIDKAYKLSKTAQTNNPI